MSLRNDKISPLNFNLVYNLTFWARLGCNFGTGAVVLWHSTGDFRRAGFLKFSNRA